MRKRWIVAFEIIQLFLYLIYSQTMTSSCMRIGDGSASAEREENVNRRRKREKEPLHYLPCSFVHIYTRAGDFLISTGCMVKWHLRVCACGFLWFILREEAQLTLGGISAHEANQTRASARLWPSAYMRRRRRWWPIIFPAFCAPNSILWFRQICLLFMCATAAFIYKCGARFCGSKNWKWMSDREQASERWRVNIRPQNLFYGAPN